MRLIIAAVLAAFVITDTLAANETNIAAIRKCRRKFEYIHPLPDGSPGLGCRASIKKWWWNDDEGQCSEGKYSGCNGTDNQFDTLDDCWKACGFMRDVPHCVWPPPINSDGCQTRPIMRPSDGCIELVLHCRGRPTTPPCPPLPSVLPDKDCGIVEYKDKNGCWNVYVDCQAGKFLTDKVRPPEPSANDTTKKPGVTPPVTTPAPLSPGYLRKCRRQFEYIPPLADGMPGLGCRASIKKWHWNDDEGQCDEVNYSGCNGTDNLFDNVTQCWDACGQMRKATKCPKTPNVNPPPGCQIRVILKMEDGCIEDAIHCRGRKHTPGAQCPPLAGVALPKDCSYVEYKNKDGCPVGYIDCQAGKEIPYTVPE